MAPSRAEFTVRQLDTGNPSDMEAYKASTVRLQDFEATLDDRFLPGEQIIDSWVDHVLSENRRSGGAIFVVEAAATGPVGFVWAKVLPSPPERNIFLKPRVSIYLYDMQVEEPYLEQGAGEVLLDRVVDFAREKKYHK
jgi:GNAT superfamily N-acetyltransferase